MSSHITWGRGHFFDDHHEAVMTAVCLPAIRAKVTREFLELPSQERLDLLEAYRADFGESAYNYATKTMEKWASRKIGMSRATEDRILTSILPFMSFSLKIDIAQHLYDRSIVKETAYIDVDDTMTEFFDKIVKTRFKNVMDYKFPDQLISKFSWAGTAEANAIHAEIRKTCADEFQSMYTNYNKSVDEINFNLRKMMAMAHDGKDVHYTHAVECRHLKVIFRLYKKGRKKSLFEKIFK